ncbi:MAG: hypothetical protein JXR61_06345 [Prolixibacteraceae bacterium]|nr:hypothetical protein [Prolixibacteraceae bacterium]
MQPIAKLIYKTHTTHLPTVFPVHYFGLPNGRVYLIYGRFYEKGFDKSGLEFVLAKHKEFYYEYESEKLKAFNSADNNKSIYVEEIDKPNPEIKIIKVYRNIDSYSAAINKLNKRAVKADKEKAE